MRGKSVVWEHFNCDEDEGNGASPMGGKSRPAAYCSYCKLKYTFPNATKMMRHLLKCTLCPSDTKRELEQSGFGEYRNTDQQGVSFTCSHEEDGASPGLVRPIMTGQMIQDNDSPTPGTSALSPHSGYCVFANSAAGVDHGVSRVELVSRGANQIDEQEQNSVIDRALAKAVLCTDVPLTITENSHWQRFFRLMKPSYSAPSKETLLGSLLVEEYLSVFDIVSAELRKAKFAAIMMHRRSMHNTPQRVSEGQVNIVVTTPKPIFLGCMDVGKKQAPSDIAEVITGVITKVEPARVLLLVTNLNQEVRESWPIVSERFSYTTIVGYPVEGLHRLLSTLLVQDSIMSMVKRASNVCEYRNLLIDGGAVLEPESVKLSFSCSEDGCFQSDSMISLQTLMECKDFLQQSVVTSSPNVKADTKETVLNKNFWDALSVAVKTWRAVHLSISNLEREEARLSDVAVEIVKVEKQLHDTLSTSPLGERERVCVASSLDDMKSACCQAIHYAACLVDPRYCGNCLSEDATNDAIQYIVELGKDSGQHIGRLLANLAEYRAKDGGLWSRQYVWDAASHVAPATWWKGICDKQPLAQIAMGILNLPVTSRMSTVVQSIHGESLNRELSQKLLFVRANSELCTRPNVQPDMIVLPGGY